MKETKIHQYVDRVTGRVCSEQFIGDRYVQLLYSPLRERAPMAFKALISRRVTDWLAFFAYDLAALQPGRTRKLARALNICEAELLDPDKAMRSPRNLFERQIRYWECRPMPQDEDIVVSPADARCMIGSFDASSMLFLKEKFFATDEILGERGTPWYRYFANADYAIFRLTPDKYHYNHCPVSGVVADIYEVDGAVHSCNPYAVALARPHAKNRRVVTIFDTNVPGGSGVGYVAMIEVVAMMIGGIIQCYSAERYENPQPLEPFQSVRRGQPKSLYHPGSSVDILLFEKDRIRWDEDLVLNSRRADVASRLTADLVTPVVETDVKVRSSIGRRVELPSVGVAQRRRDFDHDVVLAI